MTQLHPAATAQLKASNPNVSTWLAANAGSGKTRVLTDRVARLLLNGVQPQKILCLTYTKAAANEMQNRLFARLGGWAMLSDDALRSALSELGVDDTLDIKRLKNARTLFARAVETPGGLKIQTVHSFCAAVLRQFPLEAGVSPNFVEMEERATKLLRAEIIENLAESKDASLVAQVARHPGGEDLDQITSAISGYRQKFNLKFSKPDIYQLFGLNEDFNSQDIEVNLFHGDERKLLHTLIEVMSEGTITDKKNAEKLSSIRELNIDACPILESVFLTGAQASDPFSAKIDKVPTKKTLALFRHNEALRKFMRRIEDARQKRVALQSAEMTFDLHQFAGVFLVEYEKQKMLRGWLDFDDLIFRCQMLLNDPNVSQWVLFRLDGGINHILIDEAQDTSPEQWNVIERLSDEFTSGQGAHDDLQRSIFVVGDKKQSIYSFQGADPSGFDKMKKHFHDRLSASGQLLQDCALEYSFRSAPAVLSFIDVLFQDNTSIEFKEQAHKAFKELLPGRVDIWPCIEVNDERKETQWYDPIDHVGEKHHTVMLAEEIAKNIKEMIDGQTLIPTDDGARPVNAGDFLILVQRRSVLFSEIIRACKGQALPIAGADRLKVGMELAVKDIAAVLSFLAIPDDNLSLAAALRSPLFGLSEKDLFEVAHKRPDYSSLWQELKNNEDKFSKVVHVLKDLRDKVDFLRPYDLIERLLTRHQGRKNLIGRLGQEAEDGINALLAQALAYERTEIPSLTGFLFWMETDDLEIKRQIDGARNMVRVMTVHGAKGLESPIVILPDTNKRSFGKRAPLILIEDIPVWRVAKTVAPENILNAIDNENDREEAERLRLLYVAASRAEKWLIVAAAGELDTKEERSWYQQLKKAISQTDAVRHDFSLGNGLRLESGEWLNLVAMKTKEEISYFEKLPEFFFNIAPTVDSESDRLLPSGLGGEKALSGDLGIDKQDAMEHGTSIHALLEILPTLPREKWYQAANRILNLDSEEAMNLLFSEVRGVLENPDLIDLFGKSTFAEVPITAECGAARLYGIIDRLVVKKESILAVDYKTNTQIPGSPEQVPNGLLRQMAAYTHALSQVYPDRLIETAILWTKTATLMMLPKKLVLEEGKCAPYLDEVWSDL
ncbi:MAG: double-strand break repair helicase AddA [Aestuariivita sp.]|nr:double-strand break repair helicase AddA [Aestuariivita sp.]